ncbi:MAG: hypothetical protein L6R35_005650, partial [Caloplaca aegaea]
MPGSTPFASINEVEKTFKKLAFKPPTCDGSRYGRSLQTASCQEALLAIPRDQREITFGKRSRGQWNINLPHRFLSRASPTLSTNVSMETGVRLTFLDCRTADGTCAIEITEPAVGFMDISSGFELARAAWAVIMSCVYTYKQEGGRADGI